MKEINVQMTQSAFQKNAKTKSVLNKIVHLVIILSKVNIVRMHIVQIILTVLHTFVHPIHVKCTKILVVI